MRTAGREGRLQDVGEQTAARHAAFHTALRPGGGRKTPRIFELSSPRHRRGRLQWIAQASAERRRPLGLEGAERAKRLKVDVVSE